MRILTASWPADVLARQLETYSASAALEQVQRDLPRSGVVRVVPGWYPAFALAATSQIGWALPYQWMVETLREPLLSTSDGRGVCLETHGVVHRAIFRTCSGVRWTAWYSVRWAEGDMIGSSLLLWASS